MTDVDIEDTCYNGIRCAIVAYLDEARRVITIPKPARKCCRLIRSLKSQTNPNHAVHS
jgi:hypothetical protein